MAVHSAETDDGTSSSERGRRIAFCVAKWNQPTSVLTWAWLRQYFLRHDKDELYIVHSGRDDKDEHDDRWKQGGPVISDLDTALQDYKHHIIILQGSLRSNIASGVVDKYNIDVVILGEDFPREGGFSFTSVSEWVKSNITTPFIIIRAGAVRNERLRLGGSMTNLGSPTSSRTLSPDSAPGRKVAIAYPSFSVGRGLIEIAKQMALLPNDEVYVVHCFPTGNLVIKHTKNIIKTIAMGLPTSPKEEVSSEEVVTEDNSIDFGAKELAGYNVQLNVVLRGDPRYSLVSFCASEGIELLVLSTRTASRIRKTFSGGSVSGFVIDKAPCPCLIIPHKALGVVDEDTLSPIATEVSEVEWVGDEDVVEGMSPSSTIKLLKAQVAERDRMIEALLDEIAMLKSMK